MKATEFEVGDVISDGDMVGWVYKEHGRRAYTYTTKATGRSVAWLDELTGDGWHRLIPECVLTEADRVTDLSTLKSGDQVIVVNDKHNVAREWCDGYGLNQCDIYRDPRPMPRIVVAKEKTLEEKLDAVANAYEGSLSGFVIASVKAIPEIAAMLKGATP